MKAHYYKIASGEIVLVQDAHDPAAAEAAGYGDPSEYGVLFCSDQKTMEYHNGQWIHKRTLETSKEQKIDEISSSFNKETFEEGKFLSTTLGIEIDCRRTLTKNDKQNVDGLIDLMTESGMTEIEFVGVSATKPKTTIVMLEKVKTEMSKFVYDQYQKKFALEKQIEQAKTIEAVEAIKW
jgi:ATP-dependent DNA ligase